MRGPKGLVIHPLRTQTPISEAERAVPEGPQSLHSVCVRDRALKTSQLIQDLPHLISAVRIRSNVKALDDPADTGALSLRECTVTAPSGSR